MTRPAFNTNGGEELEVGLRASKANGGRGRIGSAPLGFPIRAALASPARVGLGTALAMLEVRQAAQPFVGVDAAREMVNTIASILVLEPGGDVHQLALDSIARLQNPELTSGPKISRELTAADVEACAYAMARAWAGDR